MAHLLITTVGTSLLTNRDDRPWAGWNGRAGDPLPNAEDVDQWLDQAEAVTASAETNTLYAIGVHDLDHILFLHSDTPEGRFCSERLQHFYAKCCRQVDGRSLTALGYSHASFSQKGLKVLVEEAIKAVREAREKSLHPVFCATGGFKAEIAFLNLLGALFEVEVYYIHEQFREIIRLPRLPLNWDMQWVLERQDFFQWIDDEPRPSTEVENRLKARPELRPLIEDDADGNSYLNAAGDLLFRVAKERLSLEPHSTWPDVVAKSPQEKDRLSDVEHHRPKGWKNFVSRLCAIDCVSQVSYDKAAFGGEVIKMLDGANGVIAVRYGKDGEKLPLRIETSARGTEQTELVKEYIARCLRN